MLTADPLATFNATFESAAKKLKINFNAKKRKKKEEKRRRGNRVWKTLVLGNTTSSK